MNPNVIRSRAAQLLGWTPAEVGQFSLLMLRELVKDRDPKLAEEISATVAGGHYIFGERQQQ